MKFTEYNDCCGCGACAEACPKNAIAIKTDEYGFAFASLNESLCIECNKCKNVCPVIKNDYISSFEKKAYAATSIDPSSKNSSSGGIFALLAKKVLNIGGIVFGTEMNENFDVKVIGISNENELIRLQGSKYVQSNMISSFKKIKESLQKNKTVLFCGTPCQVSALKNYIGNNENLFLIDIVCHGVPSNQMFKDEIAYFKKKYNDNLIDFKFRDKKYGHDTVGSLVFKNNKEKKLLPYNTPYYFFFLKNDIFRENCYNCKYANINRPGDITICDYWGIDKEEPEFLKICTDNGFVGISGIIINTQKGISFFNESKNNLFLIETTVEKIQKHNPNLTEPSKKGENYEIVRSIYKQNGWTGVGKYYRKKYRVNIFMRKIYDKTPTFAKKFITKLRTNK